MSDKSLTQLKSFISSYKRLFLNIYTDTGIFDESIILKNYTKLSRNLDRDIRDWAKNILLWKIILWRQKIDEITDSISFSVWNYLVVIHYTEDSKLQEREITNISFYKK